MRTASLSSLPARGVAVGDVGGDGDVLGATGAVGLGVVVDVGGVGPDVVRVAPTATPPTATTARTAVTVVMTTRRW
jgi:hypothetical protein